ncbi:hypothetical protein QKU48_gp0638 [Fadolivirus algeromassiliense]|jgi:hypothetical protein|uniref:Uncharacterized protein n=1 Tax=Fadolivirus FV1/VV64 TaxID=3070911 RepID=A0A7D3V7L5_9VIRU|nr:hypothetical protein QKU48_gp0638 [Fadolivirus algeromassiliense]QKF94096.1 hypothetical protein Fadolivirus_1_638 [Fadolivirus FV1/VV64]
MEQEQTPNQEQQTCGCQICGGQCPKCRMEGCGMCPFCQRTRCPVCPLCAAQQEPFIGQETLQRTVNRFNLTFERVALFLILLLVAYVAWKHYNE